MQTTRPATFDEVLAFAERLGRPSSTGALDRTDPATPRLDVDRRQDRGFVCAGWPTRPPSTASMPSRPPAATNGIDPSWRRTASTSSCSRSSPRVAADAAAAGRSVHLHCTDVAGEWLVVDDGAGGYVVTREHAKGDAAIRGTAHDLLMVLWRRLPLDAVEVIGDRAVAERFVARSDLGG